MQGGSSELNSLCFLVFGVPKKLPGGIVTAWPFSHRGRAVTTKEREKRERRALLSGVGLSVSFEIL